MSKYESDENLELRTGNFRYYGHDSNVRSDQVPSEKGHVVEITDSYYVSKPCWTEICKAADLIDTVTLDFNRILDWKTEAEYVDVHQFFFSIMYTAKKIAIRVKSSARNIRKDDLRIIRLDEAGGFHNKEVLEQLFVIQQGYCYYSGDPIIKHPKNFAADYIRSIYKGGTDWPNNFALVINEINTWKGGHASASETFRWLANKLVQRWLRTQKAYCKEVDRKRKELHFEFQRQHENGSKYCLYRICTDLIIQQL